MASVAATNQTKYSLQQRVEYLEQQVAYLQTFQWTDQDAVDVTAQEVWERITSCRIPQGLGYCSELDPVLYAFKGQNVPNHVILRLYTEGYWTAQSGGDGDNWQVSVTITTQDGYTYGPFYWYVFSSTRQVWSIDYYAAHYSPEGYR
jgi:hypothetical protein